MMKNLWRRFLEDETGAICLGCGVAIVDGALSAEISALPGNVLTCEDDGLYVPAVGGVAISSDACNAIDSHADGLWAPCQRGVAGRDQHDSPQNADLPVSAGTGPGYDFESVEVTISNPTCRDVEGTLIIRSGGLFVNNLSSFVSVGAIDTKVDGGAWGSSTPNTEKYVQGNGAITWDYNNLTEVNYIAVAAGASHTYQARIHVNVIGGTGDLFGTVGFEFNWTLVPTAAC